MHSQLHPKQWSIYCILHLNLVPLSDLRMTAGYKSFLLRLTIRTTDSQWFKIHYTPFLIQDLNTLDRLIIKTRKKEKEERKKRNRTIERDRRGLLEPLLQLSVLLYRLETTGRVWTAQKKWERTTTTCTIWTWRLRETETSTSYASV